MSTHLIPSPASAPSSSTPADQAPGRIGRVVLGSLLAGVALALTLLVGGVALAAEPVVDGAVLLAFAASWGLLAWWSDRRTDQPQRWALVPSGVFAVLGLGYLLVQPGSRVLDASAWCWPPVLLALAAWVVVRSRRSLVGWSRRAVVYPVAAVMALAAVGAGYQTVSEATDFAPSRGPGRLVSVGDHSLWISCIGSGSPTVVLEPGLGEPGVMMAGWVQPAVAATTRVCVYDRAGRGHSTAAPGAQDGLTIAGDLHRLLANAHETGPYVLVGHSSGGAYVKVFAHQYPGEVAGMVLLDSQPNDAMTRLPGYATFYRVLHRATGIAPSIARLGAARLFSTTAVADLPPAARAEERADWSTAAHYRSLRDEVAGLPRALRQAGALTTLDGKPLVVVTAAKDAMAGWMPLQDEMLALSTNSVHRVVAEATHASLTEDGREATVSARAVADVVAAVRSGAPLTR